MNRINSFVAGLGRSTRVLLLALAVTVAGAGVVQAATTISTNITTAGTLSVTDQTTLGNASSTMLTAYSGFFGTSATSTLGADGSLTLVAGLSGTTGTFSSTLGVTGATTLASTTATGMKVGQVGTRMTRIVSGYCVTASTAIAATGATSTPTFVECVPSGGSSIISSGDRVFVQATSSLPSYVTIQAASSTSPTAGSISVQLVNIGTAVGAAVYAFNFWAFQ